MVNEKFLITIRLTEENFIKENFAKEMVLLIGFVANSLPI